jgi:hypothetical protein
MVEKWNIGYENADDGLILFYDKCHIKIDLIPPIPIFQHSIIPVPHGIRLRQSLYSLT